MHEHLDIARQRFAHDNYARSLGIVLDDLTHDTIRMHMQLRDDMLNWFSRVHGGAIYALADAAFQYWAITATILPLPLTAPSPTTQALNQARFLLSRGKSCRLRGAQGHIYSKSIWSSRASKPLLPP